MSPGVEDLYPDEAQCRVCGCTENAPCPGGCWWVEDLAMGDLCSSCATSDLDGLVGHIYGDLGA